MIFFFFSFFLFIETFFLSWNLTEEVVFFQIIFFILVFLIMEVFRVKDFTKERIFNNNYFLNFKEISLNYNIFLKINLLRKNFVYLYYSILNFLFFKKLVSILSSFRV